MGGLKIAKRSAIHTKNRGKNTAYCKFSQHFSKSELFGPKKHFLPEKLVQKSTFC